ncbi:hypothetical protein A3Q56_03875 [Intoshia linei]|uniref:Ribosomal RNA methyltransferase FtsJ domain-containing protein n=1 Tax=Intoshia linei TaxID=1819745 RepID=A0A177B259_9BILA|nr:hypothetical protein A3Q56_03875 [Intoshia linei]
MCFSGVMESSLCPKIAIHTFVYIFVIRPGSKIVAVDLQPMFPLEGVVQIQADITQIETVGKILSHFNDKVDLVICDGAPDVTGLHDMDEYIQSELIFGALNIAIKVLKKHGTFVAKVFRGNEINFLYSQLKILFVNVSILKPRSSRISSLEAFVVCQDYNPSDDFTGLNRTTLKDCEMSNKELADSIPYVVCGDFSKFDSDCRYSLEMPFEEYEFKNPVVEPSDPPYKEGVHLKRTGKL